MDRSTERVSDLLTLRDGEPLDAARARALAVDPAQQARIRAFGEIRRGLQALPVVEPAPASLSCIERSIAARAARARARRRFCGAAAGIALALGAALAGYRVASPPAATPGVAGAFESERATFGTAARPGGEISALRALSRDLERSLAAGGGGRDPAERALLYRLADLDTELAAVAPAQRDRDARELWRQRVVLLDALAQVRGPRPAAHPVAHY